MSSNCSKYAKYEFFLPCMALIILNFGSIDSQNLAEHILFLQLRFYSCVNAQNLLFLYAFPQIIDCPENDA